MHDTKVQRETVAAKSGSCQTVQKEHETDEKRGRVNRHLKRLVSTLPKAPGVYQFKDDEGRVIYIGKAKNLRNRVRTYFQKTPKRAYPKTEVMRRRIADIEIITVGTELEALILETNLIKQKRPKYNVTMRDDKNFLYVKITVQQDFPEIFTVRRMQKDGAHYFGPYTSAESVRKTLKILRNVFPYRTCTGLIEALDVPPSGSSAAVVESGTTPAGKEELRQGQVLVRIKKLNRMAPCLDYHIKQCSAPCIGAVAKDAYRVYTDTIERFLKGHTRDLVELIRERMDHAAQNKQFEDAAKWRDQLQSLERVLERQQVVSPTQESHDVIGIAADATIAIANVFQVRNGLLIGREAFPMKIDEHTLSDEDILERFMSQYYTEVPEIPGEILAHSRSESSAVVETFLSGLRGGRVTIRAPRRGIKRRLVELAEQNAKRQLEEQKVRWMTDEARTKGALSELRAALGTERLHRIECYDISHIQGTGTTGSMVVFVDGLPHTANYRRFTVKRLPEGKTDDYAALMEVLERRLVRMQTEVREDSFSEIPDLIILDGGKGQLHSVMNVVHMLGLQKTLRVIALAKRNEEIFLTDQSDPLILPRNSNVLFLVQRIRDEAHRFAISHHRHIRSKKMVSSVLDEIPGVGPSRKKKLIKAFGSVTGIRQAPIESIASIVGEQAARNIKDVL